MNKSIARKLSLTEDGFFNNGTNNTVMYSVDIAGYIALDLLKKAALLRNSVREPNCLQLIDSYTTY